MYYCSFINFKGSLNSSIKADFIDEYLRKNHFDILFVTNYKSNSLNFDVVFDGENVFIDTLEDQYNIYKGEITNNICNIIIVKKALGYFVYNNLDIDDNYRIKPLQIYNKDLNLHLLCFDNFIDKINNINNYIIGGVFDEKLNNIVSIDLENNKFSNNKIDKYTSNLGYDDAYKRYYLEKYKYGIIFDNLNFDNLIIRKTHIFSNDIIETILSQKYSNFKSINYVYNIFQNLKRKIF